MPSTSTARDQAKSEAATESRFIGFLLVVLATICWSTSGIFINFISQGSQLTPVGLAFWRDLATFLVLAGGIAALKPDLLRINRRDVPWLAAMGALSIASFHVLWNTSVLMNGVSISTVIQCNAPVFVTLMAWLIWGEPLSGVKIVAILLAFIGIVLISRLDQLSGMEITVLGLTIALGSAILYGSFSLFGKKLAGSYSTWTILTYVFGFAALALMPFQFFQGSPLPADARAVGSFVGLVILTTVLGFGMYTSGLRRLQASVASITSNSEVAFAALLSYLLLGERLDGWQILGAILVVGGVSLLSVPGLRERRRRNLQAKMPPAG
ncbi:MAG: DMT family transporter [Anaerolineales bacterium]